jgi:uncharacterized coiled-coil protein SlyX
MTLGTNATLEELIKYSPQEIDFDFILAELKELEEWRELGESVGDVEGRINVLEIDIELKDKQIENLEYALDDANNEIERLKETIENLTPSD